MEFLVKRTDFYRFYAKKSHIEGQVRFLDPTWQKSWFLAFSKGFHDGSQNASYVAFWGTKSFWVPKNHQNFDFLPFNYIFWVKSAIWDNFDFCHFLLGKPPIFKWKNLWNLQNSFFLNCVWSVFSKICHIILKIMIEKTCFWPHIPLNKQITLWILCRGSSCFLTPSQRYNFKCCFCCFCCVFGYHGVVFRNLHEK